MPAATTSLADKTEKEEQLWLALKTHILHERQRKKQEQEAEVEEERLRKEREARERQDVMTLGETREQIQILDAKLQELKNEKQQLFLQLKKVLNEDEVRKKQQQQKESEIYAMHSAPQGQPGTHSQPLMPPRPMHQQPPLIQKTGQPMGVQTGQLKRPRSPSPTQGYNNYSHSAKMEDNRRGNEGARAVLWNKPSQYTNTSGTLFYPANQTDLDSLFHRPTYPHFQQQHLRQNYHVNVAQPPPPQPPPPTNTALIENQGHLKTSYIYPIELEKFQPPGLSRLPHKSHQPHIIVEKLQDRMGYNMEIKLDEHKDSRPTQHQPPQQPPAGIIYESSLRPGQIPLHPGGSITQGYANRNPPPPQQQTQQPNLLHCKRHFSFYNKKN